MKVLSFCLALLIESQVTSAQCGRSNNPLCDNVEPCFDPFDPPSPTCFEGCTRDDDCVDGEVCRTLGTCGNRFGATPCTFGCDACEDNGEDDAEFICMCFEDCPRVNGEFPTCSESRRSRCIGEEFQNPDSSSETLFASCLSGYSQVNVLHKGPTYLKDVQQGDKVMVSSSADNESSIKYQEVYGFGHRDVYSVATFIQFKTSSDHEASLEITGEHLIMKQGTLSGSVFPVRADSIQVGDILIGGQGVGEKVVEISSIQRPGLYSPLTKGGNLLVNGVQVSSYTAVQDKHPEIFTVGNLEMVSHHLISHAAMAPFRIMCLVGGFSQVCEERNAEGQLLFVNQGENLTSWIMKQALEMQMVSLSLLLTSIIYFYSLEQLFGSFLITVYLFPLISLLISGFLYSSQFNKKSVGEKK